MSKNFDKMANYSLPDLFEFEQKKPKPHEIFIQKLVDLTGQSAGSVIKWVKGRRYPSYPVKVLLSQYFDTPIDVLFPPREDATDDIESDDDATEPEQNDEDDEQ